MPLPRQEKTQYDGLPTQPVAAARADASGALQPHEADDKNAGPDADARDDELGGSANPEPAVPTGRTDSERRGLTTDAPGREPGDSTAGPRPDVLVGGAGKTDSECRDLAPDSPDCEPGGANPESDAPAGRAGGTDSERHGLAPDAPGREPGGSTASASPKPDVLIGRAGGPIGSESDARDSESGSNNPEQRWAEAAARARALREAREGRTKRTQPIRAINEDDDGYDPYSDFHDRNAGNPLFERDPWN